MYDYNTGVYIGNINDDWEEHFETTYYIKYNLEKALYSLNKILEKEPDFSEFSSRVTYYHFYIDSLINSIGSIYKRFSFNNRNDIDKERIIRNIKEYNYGSLNEKNEFITINYKTLNSKVRNFVEHVDEKDEYLMKDNKFYGTFNVIYKDMDPKIKKDLESDKNIQNNLLNLINKSYRVYNHYDTNSSGKRKYRFEELNLLVLKEELIKLKETNDNIFSYLKDRWL